MAAPATRKANERAAEKSYIAYAIMQEKDASYMLRQGKQYGLTFVNGELLA